MERDILERPFEEELIRTRSGHFGANLSYVEGAEYIKRLNEAFDGVWSFNVDEYKVFEREVVVTGKLTAGGVTKVAFGGATIKRSSHDGKTLGLADDLKAAATDALKKASSLLGLGLHLYGDTKTDERKEEGGSSIASLGPVALTDRQLRAIIAISRALGWSPDALRQHSLDAFGLPPDELTKTDASVFIGELQQMSAKEAA